ncbi:uncharacterized protein LOC100373605 [Saccoglossus kowalevskii]|uniref:Secretogranin 3-like protein n=1 Tax=Saccoglossus kowalevskii TaxID=10224 RepID=A0A1C9TA52_SACKO|nr:PREDICTED: secretogranin-3-like [Saccoglossus kowalevskii]AOR07021.1 secretogranin 3-like protein [Saccoglossus kowalevskii]
MMRNVAAMLVLAFLVCLVPRYNAVPFKEQINEVEIPTDEISKEILKNELKISEEEEEASGEGSGDETDFIPLIKDENINEEKTNYEDFGVDYDSFEINKNNVLEQNVDGVKCELNFDTARELATSLDRPAAIANYIISTNDIESFICVIQILIEDGLISEEEADYLEEEVSSELQKQLYDDVEYYDNDPFEEQEMMLAPGPEKDVYPDLDEVITSDMDDLLYDLAQSLYNQAPQEKEKSERKLLQFAGLIAREVIIGNLSPEEGEGYLDILARLPFGQILVEDKQDYDDESTESESQETFESEEDSFWDNEEEKSEVEDTDLDELEQELQNSDKLNNMAKVQETYYPEDEEKFGAFPDFKDNYLDDITEDIVWVNEDKLKENDAEAADLALDLGQLLDYYVDTGKLSDKDIMGVMNLLQ